MSDMIDLLDEQGRPVKMPRTEYVRQIMAMARQHWDNLDAVRQLTVQMMQQGFPEQALEIATQACKLSNDHVNDLYWRAAAKAELGQLDEAATEFAELQEDAAYAFDQARAATGLARVRWRQGKADEAAQLLEWACATDAGNPGPLLAIYGFWAEQGKPDTGMAKIQDVISAQPAAVGPHRALAQLAAQSENRDAVRTHGNDAISRAASPDDREEVIAEVTWLFGQCGMPDDIIALVEPQVTSLHHPHTLFGLAQAYEDAGRPEDAKKLLVQLRDGAPPQMQQYIDAKIQEIDNPKEPGE